MLSNNTDIRDTDSDIVLSQNSFSISKDISPKEIRFSLEFKLNFIEITDLRSAFTDGFAGYSAEVYTKDCYFATQPVDIQVNKAIWLETVKL